MSDTDASAAASGAAVAVSPYDKQPGESEWTRKEVAEQTSLGGKSFIILDNIVFDVTDFADRHPGGSAVLLEYAGRDATAAFESVGHSASARKMLLKLRIGVLVPGDRVIEDKSNKDGKCCVM